MTFTERYVAARRASTPVIGVNTADPVATMEKLGAAEKQHLDEPPILAWDCVRGLMPVNEPGKAALITIGAKPEATVNPMLAMQAALKLERRSVVYFQNLEFFLGEPQPVQMLCNLRDPFKINSRAIVLLGAQLSGAIPQVVRRDMTLLDEPLPTVEELETIVLSLMESAQLPPPEKGDVVKATDALCGLAAFPAEQAAAMCMTKKGLLLPELWEHKRTILNAIPGLKVYRPQAGSKLAGLRNISKYVSGILTGPKAPRVVCLLDEGEKSFASGAEAGVQDGGVGKDALQVFLTQMEDNEYPGIIEVGVPGSGKSWLPKVMADLHNMILITLDMGAMRGGIVGESEARIRTAFQVVNAISLGKALFFMTVNRLAGLPPELRRRFTLGTFFFDVADEEELAAAWPIYKAKYNLSPKAKTPNDKGWTIAEVRNCCMTAEMLGCSPVDAASYIVPVSMSAHDAIDTMRREADGRFISASYDGKYVYQDIGASSSGRRAMQLM